MENVHVAGLTEEFLKCTEDYRYELCIDLEELAAGNFDDTFSVNECHESNNFVDFRVYHGIDITATLPNGAENSAVQAFCDDIANRAKSLTQGFSVEWVNGNEVGRWIDEDGDQDSLDDPYDDNCRYWSNLQDHVNEIEYTAVYDLSDGDNFSYVKEAVVEELDGNETIMENILEVLNEIYEDDISTNCYVGFHDAAERIVEELTEEDQDR